MFKLLDGKLVLSGSLMGLSKNRMQSVIMSTFLQRSCT